MNRRAVNLLLLLGVVLIVGVCLVLGAPNSAAPEGEKFGGTDAAVTEELDGTGYEPWFGPIFSPGSSEVESGLFALQAGLGGGVLGYCLGALRTRHRMRRAGAATASIPPAPSASSGPTMSAGHVPSRGLPAKSRRAEGE